MFGFTSMSDYIKRTTVTEWLSPNKKKITYSNMKKPRGKQLEGVGGGMIS